MRKIPRHDHASVINAPSAGPATAPNAPVAPVIPMTVDRLCAGNAGSTTAIAVGEIIAPPTPCTTRAAISSPALGARPDSIDPSMKMATPGRKSRLRPRLSA